MRFPDTPKTACRTPAEGKDGVTNIPSWKYDAVRGAIISELKAQAPAAVSFKALREAAKAHMSPEHLGALGSWGWHFTSVKLNMEVDGDIERVPGVSPQQVRLTK